MNLGGQLQAAIEVLDDIELRHRPAADALRDWGRSHRFAGSGDRATIGNLVFDCLRRRRSVAARLDDDGTRMAVIAVPVFLWNMSADEVAALCGVGHGPAALSETERKALDAGWTKSAPLPVQGDFPDWLEASFTRAFGDDLLHQMSALNARAPVDLRVNTLKADRDKVLRNLARFNAGPTPHSPLGIRLPPPQAGGRYPNVEAEAGHGKGWFEVQDEGSQLATLIAGVEPGAQVIDLCAGAGGKTLALSAALENKGQVYAYDSDRNRLRRIFDRLKRAGARNVQVLEAGDEAALSRLEGRMDVVFVDAPCTGSGTWRRRPDAKWRLNEQALERRCAEQRAVLALGTPLVKPGGRLVYVTCSLLPEENGDQVDAFLKTQPGFTLADCRSAWDGAAALQSSAGPEGTLTLTPAHHGTDGFFITVLEKQHAA